MRYLIPLLLLLTGCATSSTMPDGTPRPNAIVIQTSDAPDDAYRTIAQILQRRGYGLENTDATLRSITTGSREIRRASTTINASVSNGTATEVLLTGQLTTPAFDDPSRIYMGGQSGSPARLAWEELAAIARAYPNGEITHTRL